MALSIKKSMEVSNFWESWKLIKALVKDEYGAVKGREGFYDLTLELVWDCEDEEDALAAREAVQAYRDGWDGSLVCDTGQRGID